MAPVPEESRARIRASVMWLIAAIVMVGVGIAAYAGLAGFAVTSATTVTAAAPINDGHGLLVRYQVGSSSCEVPGGVTVTETAEAVTLTSSAIDPTGTKVVNKACSDDLYSTVGAVWLEDPLAGRTVLDSSGAEIELSTPVEVLG